MGSFSQARYAVLPQSRRCVNPARAQTSGVWETTARTASQAGPPGSIDQTQGRLDLLIDVVG